MPLSLLRTYCVAMLLAASLSILATAAAQPTATSEIKDMVVLEGASPKQLVGYGLVVGLDRTGDRARGRRGAAYTVQSIANMLREFGVTVNPDVLGSRNAAAVMITATMDPFNGPGSQLDVTVSALGDARSLSGGVLLQTPLLDPSTKQQYALAQGPLVTGAAQASSQGTSVKINNPNTGRVPNGAIVTAAPPVTINDEEVGLVLRRPDFTNADKITEAINEVFPESAETQNAGLVQVQVPQALTSASQLMAALEGITVEVDAPARVVINERTGTIVAGGNVTISEVMVTYGGITISTREDRFVSQPNPLGEGETVPFSEGNAEVNQRGAQSVVLPPNTSVNELATALNELGVTARDVISIFQSIDRAQALQAELVIL
jgi:flagellar P-ring protein precursor FlgI